MTFCKYIITFPFTGKERDEETGYGYFGARYMDHELSTTWLSVDPMADKYPSISPYAYCVWNPMRLVDPDGEDWYEIVNENTGEKEVKWTDYHSQEEMNKNSQSGTYLGEVFIHFEGSMDESLGDNNKMDGEGAITATVTIYGKNNEKDIHKYKGMTTPCSNDYSTLNDGDYHAYYQDMATSVYGETGAKKRGVPAALTYRITQLDGNTTLQGKRNGKPIDMTGVFMHRTDWDGNASKSSKGCLVIDGRNWRDVEKQIGKSNNIYIRVSR